MEMKKRVSLSTTMGTLGLLAYAAAVQTMGSTNAMPPSIPTAQCFTLMATSKRLWVRYVMMLFLELSVTMFWD
jgi:hypothetical protein